jgi:hypothetical protein
MAEPESTGEDPPMKATVASVAVASVAMACHALPAAQEKGKPFATHRYVPLPPGTHATPGGLFYAHLTDDTPLVPIATDAFALDELRKALLADDQAGVDELQKAGRLFAVPTGTALRVIEYHDGSGLVRARHYEVRVADEGKHKDRKGWLLAIYLKGRVPVGPGPRRKR